MFLDNPSFILMPLTLSMEMANSLIQKQKNYYSSSLKNSTNTYLYLMIRSKTLRNTILMVWKTRHLFNFDTASLPKTDCKALDSSKIKEICMKSYLGLTLILLTLTLPAFSQNFEAELTEQEMMQDPSSEAPM